MIDATGKATKVEIETPGAKQQSELISTLAKAPVLPTVE
jgi:hypothetical protein